MTFEKVSHIIFGKRGKKNERRCEVPAQISTSRKIKKIDAGWSSVNGGLSCAYPAATCEIAFGNRGLARIVLAPNRLLVLAPYRLHVVTIVGWQEASWRLTGCSSVRLTGCTS